MNTDTVSNNVAIIGAGPCGLFQVFELGLLGLGAEVIESLPQAGGQCAELYPEKPIYDIPAIPVCTGKELTENLLQQIKPFAANFHYNCEVQQIERQENGRLLLSTSGGTNFDVAAVVIAAGAGSFQPTPLRIDGSEELTNSKLFYRVKNKSLHAGKRLVIAGGGDSALDWVIELVDSAASMTLVHRSDSFRAQPASVARMRELCKQGKMDFLLGTISQLGLDRFDDSKDSHLMVTQAESGESSKIACDHLLCFFGLLPKPGPINNWGLAMHKNHLLVDTEKFQTSREAIFAVGDINHYAGKKKLILSGFHEAALAAFAIKQHLEPDKKIHLQYTTTSPLLHQRLGV